MIEELTKLLMVFGKMSRAEAVNSIEDYLKKGVDR